MKLNFVLRQIAPNQERREQSGIVVAWRKEAKVSGITTKVGTRFDICHSRS